MIVFLQELVFALDRLVGDELGVDSLLDTTFLLRHITHAFYGQQLFFRAKNIRKKRTESIGSNKKISCIVLNESLFYLYLFTPILHTTEMI